MLAGRRLQKWASAKDVMALASARNAMERAVGKGCSPSLSVRNAAARATVQSAKVEAELDQDFLDC